MGVKEMIESRIVFGVACACALGSLANADLTVDVGRNPGAIAISYLVNNQGAIERVALRGSGHIGLALLRPTLGPGLISELTVDGFAMGIAAAGPCCSMVFEHIHLRNQSVAGSEDQPSLFRFPAVFVCAWWS